MTAGSKREVDACTGNQLLAVAVVVVVIAVTLGDEEAVVGIGPQSPLP